MSKSTSINPLLFIYNADSGIGAALRDSLHKLVSPNTYGCSLCAVTYGPLTMRREWRHWLSAAPFDTRFMYCNELARAYPKLHVPLPAILIEGEGPPFVLLGPDTLDVLRSIDALIARIEAALGGANLSA